MTAWQIIQLVAMNILSVTFGLVFLVAGADVLCGAIGRWLHGQRGRRRAR